MAKVWGKKAQNRELIIKAAREVMMEKGASKITYQDVAEKADMSRTTVFNHFPSMQSLMESVMESDFEESYRYYCNLKSAGTDRILDLFLHHMENLESNLLLTMTELSTIVSSERGRTLYQALDQKMKNDLSKELTDQERNDIMTDLTGVYAGVIFRAYLYEETDPKIIREDFLRLAREILGV